MEENIFENNIGCNKVPGALSIIQCSEVYQDPEHSELLQPVDYLNDNYKIFNYLHSTKYKVNPPVVVPSYLGVDISVDLNIIKFKSNVWRRNYASTAPIIKLVFGRYNLQNETYLQCGNSFNETFEVMGYGDILYIYPIPDIYTLLGGNPGSSRHLQQQGVIYTLQVYELIITNCTFDQNWAYEVYGGDANIYTATDLYVSVPGGYLLIDNTIFQNHKGMEASILDPLYSIDYAAIINGILILKIL